METNIKDIEDLFGFPKIKREREEVPANEDFSDRVLDVTEVMKDTDKTSSVSGLDLIEETPKEVKVEEKQEVKIEETLFGEMGDEDTDIVTNVTETVFSDVDDSISVKTPLEEGPLDKPLEETVDDGMDAILGVTTPQSTKSALEDTLAETGAISQTMPLQDDVVLDPVKENEQIKKEQKEMEIAEKDVVKDDVFSIEDNTGSNVTPNVTPNIDHGLPEGEIDWITSSENAKFDYFYNQKVSIIRTILRGKQLPFERYESELRDSYCDTGSNIYDLPQLYKNMTNVQGFRDRVCQIQTEVNSQYYKWDRTVELLRGVLARTQYERGKQEGVIFENMRDMELYLESLKSIHKTADIIHKNLDAAFDLLSRQVTISQNDKPIDRNQGDYNSNVSSSYPTETYTRKETPETLTDYDDLPVSGGTVAIGPKVKKKSVQGVEIKSWDKMPV